MAPVHVGSGSIKGGYIGSTPLEKIYRGSTELWSANRAPERVGSLSNIVVQHGSSRTVSVASAFSDPDGDTLTITASSSNTLRATVSVSGNNVTVVGQSPGSATTITVTATDPGGLSVEQTFTAGVTPRTPSIISATRTLLTCSSVTGATSYTFNVQLGISGIWHPPGSNETSSTTTQTVSLGTGNQWRVRVRANNAQGSSSWSGFTIF